MDNQPLNNKPSPVPESLRKYDSIPGATPREKLRNAHAQLRASANAGPFRTVSASATPSSAGDIEPAPPASIPEAALPLSVRVDKEPVPHDASVEVHQPPADTTVSPPLLYAEQPDVQTIQPSALTFDQTESYPPGSLRLGPSEFAITMPMDSRVKDHYERALAQQMRTIQRFLSGFTDAEDQIISAIRGLIERLDHITLHPDLTMAEHIKDSEPDPQKEAAWAEYSSSKFQFLGHFIEVATTHDLHIVVMAKKGKAVEFVERYFLGKGFIYTRPRHEMRGNVEVSMTNGSLSVAIRSTQHDGVLETYKPPSAIIALDSSFNAANPSVEHLRTTYARNGNLLPVILLIVSNTSEHIQRCLPDVSELQKLRLLVHCVTSLSRAVGDLQDDALGVHEDAEEVLSYLLSDNFNLSWALPAIEPLNMPNSEETAGSGAVGSTYEHLSAGMTPLQKRVLDTTEDDAPDSKRQRLTSSQSQSQEQSQFTDSSKPPSQRLDTDLKALENSLLRMKSEHANELNQLKTTLSNVEARLVEREKMLESLQHRYESRTRELHQMRKERDNLADKLSKAEQRIERQQDEITKLKDERTQLKHDLEAARNDLKAEGGRLEELEAAREEVRRLTKENASLERKAEYERKQAEYTREQYQNASTAAAQSAMEIRQLKDENQQLKRKIAAEAVQLRQVKTKNDEMRHLQRVRELELMVASRDELLRRKEDELRELKRNRPATRSTSTQPRSPKWGPGNSRPTSPGITSNNSSNNNSSNNNNNSSSNNGRGSALRFSSEMSTL
ncbi:hypothetical protein T310_6406 [Rasamsonia emersonii CBS 393.64]|uniref:HDA1 complex subunit n=1 Tax=Rasamsonia emersonii (strain ATCC 16479 / CBS 393.64 / IMI 116815) TaxID=1408163 RepID=A0A0F4YPT4_RASE3|nr:hypothetical protein T310_6406 [Rasamsonia emersonii CBS 393.64]KKA19623.1 hypothetical protein T310_6406 [Rasamsonia emersonii CBS 393.64]